MPNYDNDIQADLARMDEESDTASIAPAVPKGNNNNLDVPDGNYHARIDRLCFEQTKNQRMIILNWELPIVAGEFEGKTLTITNFTDSDDKIAWMKKDLCVAGMDAANMSMVQIHQALEAMLDVIIEVKVKHKGAGDDEKAYVYIQRRVDIDEPAPASAPAGRARTSAGTASTTANTRPAASRTATPASGGGRSGLNRM